MPATPATCVAGHSSPIYATVTAKIGGSSRPWTKRHAISDCTSCASADAGHRQHHGEHRGGDDALAAEHVGDRAGERRGQRDRERARRHDGADCGRAGAEFASKRRQQRLRRIQIEETAQNPASRDGELAGRRERHLSLRPVLDSRSVAARGALQRLLGRAGGVDRASSRARSRSYCSCRSTTAASASLASSRRVPTRCAPGREIGGQEQAAKRHPERRGRLLDGRRVPAARRTPHRRWPNGRPRRRGAPCR